ncbi:hypothetical protein [Clostridium perfringens]|uniref:hypothetical protein n=1 Tax=Clostridium perfringens TaxID=1502 RepID=UPI0039EBBD2C
MLKKLFLDLNNFKSNLGSVELGDSIELNIKLLNDEDYSRSKFRLLGAKSDGKYVEQIEGINLEEKDLKVILEDQFVNYEGIVKLELNVVSGETEITTKEFYFFVSNTMNASIIDSADSLPTLEKVSKYVDDAVDNLETLKGASEDITIINSEFKENEIKRKANEMLREKNEKARLQSEDIRITGEEERKTNELERIQAENDRKVSESNRKLAENTRKTNEAARVEAELNRQSLFEENEEIRNSNENLRIASEKERIKFNSEAKTDELNRKEAEKNRVLAEEERKSSEESRVAAEAIRQNTYTDFNDSEAERKNNEIKRQEAEALRVEAETRRDNLFSEKEEERNTSFIESEKVRNAAFNKAQDSRNTTFEESETVREEAFKISEKARNDAEELRVTAESERVKSEKLRVDSEKARVLAEEERNTTFTQKEEERNNTFTQNETNRNDTFTQSEEERKGIFEEAENARKATESKRVKTESSRVEAEKLRVTAETGRVEAENLRVTAEDERVAAETKREEGFNKFEGKINANTEELKNARSATTGEKFDTLDERIDCEVDRLNEKIDVTMLQQEDKESHVAENSVEGMTADMIVKGRTLNNFAKRERFVDNSENQHMYIQWSTTSDLYEPGMWTIKNSTGYFLQYDIRDKQTKGYIRGLKSNKSFTVVLNDNEFIANMQALGRDGVPINENTKEMLEKNCVVLKGDCLDIIDTLSYFEDIKSFGQESGEISILSHGKNLAKLDLSNKNITPFEDGYRLDCLALYRGDEDIFDLKGKYKPNTQYVLSYYGKILDNSNSNNYRLRVYYTDNTYTDGVVTGNRYEKRTIETLSGKTVYKIIGYYGAMNGDFIVKDVMLEEGTKATNYEAYKFYKKDISLLELGFDEGLRGFNNIVYDELNSIKNVVIKRIEKYIVTGEEDFTIDVRSDYMYCYFILEGSKPSAGLEAICNQFRYIDGLWNKDNHGVQGKEGFDLSGGNSLSFQLPISKLVSPNKDGVKKYFKSLNDGGKPVIVYYWLAEPIEIPLTKNINVKSFNEKTYVRFENAISGTSSFKAPVNAAATIARLNRENRALEEENKNLRQDFESTTLTLTDSDLELVKQNVDMDFRLMEVEFALDIPQAILSSDIKFKNKKGEVKSMARTPYEMMKIVILSGDYDREDYMHKVGKYYERGRMTKEEHDELMSLMTADEVISK